MIGPSTLSFVDLARHGKTIVDEGRIAKWKDTWLDNSFKFLVVSCCCFCIFC